MRRKSESQAGAAKVSRPTPVESLSEAAIKRALRSEAIQHPTTIVPLGICVLSVVYLVLFSPVLGGALAAFILLVAAGLVAVGGFLWRYTLRYADEYAKRAQEAMELEDRESTERDRAELRQLHETLRAGFADIDSDAGSNALGELVHEHQELRRVVSRSKRTDPMSVARISALADETYRQGLSVLADALELARAIHSSSVDRLKAEVAELETEIEQLKGDDSQKAHLEIREATARSHRERLDMIGKQQLRVDQLFYQSDRCEASLSRTRLEVAALRADTSETSVNAVVDTLRGTIKQAREVQEELRRIGL